MRGRTAHQDASIPLSRRDLARLFAAGALLTLLVLPAGSQPVSDARVRLGVAHAWMTGADPFEGLTPAEPLVLRDRMGRPAPWYGLGQSLVLLPADALATAAGIDTARERFIVVQYLTFPIVNGLVVVAAALFLAAAGFSAYAAVAGAVALPFCSTLLWHFQNNQENPLQLLLVLLAMTGALMWRAHGSRRWLVAMGACLGFDLLIRLPNIVDVMLVSLLPVILRPARPGYVREYLRFAAPGIAAGALIDRLYHYARFGEWTSNYMQMSGDLARRLNLPVPEGFPFSHDFWIGLAGPFVSLQASVFLFDPLLIVLLVLTAVRWKSLSASVRVISVTAGIGVLLTAAGYARYFNWTGFSGWGDRFLTTWVWVACALAIPLMMDLGVRRRVIGSLAAGLLSLQLLSVVYPAWLEEVQLGMQQHIVPGVVSVPDGRFDHFVIVQRVRNVGAAIAGAGDHAPMLPVLMPLQSLPGWLALLLRAVWVAGALSLARLTLGLLRAKRNHRIDFRGAPGGQP